MAPHDSIDEFLFFEGAFQNIENGFGVNMGDVAYIAISNEASVSNSSGFLSNHDQYINTYTARPVCWREWIS